MRLTVATVAAVMIGAVGIGLAGRAASAETVTGPAPQSVIEELEVTTDWASSLTDESLPVAAQTDTELGTPDLSRMYLLDDAEQGQSFAFPVGEHGICLLRVLPMGEDVHTVRTCGTTTAILAHGLPLRVNLVSDNKESLDETVLLLPDGYLELFVDGSKGDIVERNFVRLPAADETDQAVSVRGPSGTITPGSLSD